MPKKDSRSTRSTRSERRAQRLKQECDINESYENSYCVDERKLEALTEAQGHYIIAIQQSDITFGVGSAGTGKSYIAGRMAIDALIDKKTKKIILTRPNIEVGKSMGYLPGDEHEKYEPYIRPFKKIFERAIGPGNLKSLINSSVIEPMPVNFMRGESIDNAWVIVDEAQNLTELQLKTILTRIGKNTKVIINGDSDQIDIPARESGLLSTVEIFNHRDFNEVSIIRFTEDDSVRSKLCQKILKAYSRKTV